jgi:hypothetical protein
MSDSPLVAESGSAVGLIWHVEQPDAARPKSTPSRQPAGMATSPTRRLSGRRARARPAGPSQGRGSFVRGRKRPSRIRSNVARNVAPIRNREIRGLGSWLLTL